jgi:hypothetical protein
MVELALMNSDPTSDAYDDLKQALFTDSTVAGEAVGSVLVLPRLLTICPQNST